MTSQWTRWRLKSPASPLFTQPFIRAQIKENIKAPRHWPLCVEFTGDRWIPRTNGQLRGKCFHLMTSSWEQKTWTQQNITQQNRLNFPWLMICAQLHMHTQTCFLINRVIVIMKTAVRVIALDLLLLHPGHTLHRLRQSLSVNKE